MKKTMGWILLILPFPTLLTILGAQTAGWRITMIVYGVIAITLGLMLIGLLLISK